MKELDIFRKFITEEEVDKQVHEGTWSIGSPESRDKLAQMLTNIQMKNDSVEGMLQALKVAKDYAYKVAGDDGVFDYLDAAEAELEKGEGGFDPDYFSDHITDAILAVTKLQENDKALDEIIEENVFGEIDSNLEIMATHMSATQALETLVGELQAISGGTKVLHQALKNIVSDMKVGVYNNTKEE